MVRDCAVTERTRRWRSWWALGGLSVMALSMAALCEAAQGGGAQRPAGPPAAPPTSRAIAPIDLAGTWVALITEDWRWRMVTPAKGDYASIPLTPEGMRVADSWDPAKDEKAQESCRAYGAPAVMRGPTRLRIAWQDDDTLKVETDYGMQTRLLQFKSTRASRVASWQGTTSAQWVFSGRPPAAGSNAPRFGSLKSVTTGLRAGYLRKNGVPYSANAVYTEYWDIHTERNGDRYLVVTNVVEDPRYLQVPWVTALHFKKEAGTGQWNPEPCSTRF